MKLIGANVVRQTHPANVGGVVYIASNGGTLNVYSSMLEYNDAYHGGGLYCYSNAIVNIYNSSITSNIATGGIGGGLYIRSSKVMLFNSTIANNEAGGTGEGGGISLQYSAATLYNTTVQSNIATNNGGGIYINGIRT